MDRKIGQMVLTVLFAETDLYFVYLYAEKFLSNCDLWQVI